MSLTPGTRLGPYEIVEPLGAGGMGEVYRARDARLGRDVAVKVLPRAMAGDPERQQRFEAEARAAGSLNHPNIVTLHDVGVANGMPFLVTEVLEGESLRAVVQRGPLALATAIDVMTQVAAGLEVAHGKGLVHRDLKPENLFVLPDGRVKILDFGIAKLMRSETGANDVAETTPVFASLTATGTIMGTVSYMAPEQLRDRPVDQRADLFALGAILHELVTGHQPFTGETAADRVSAILMAEPPALSDEVETEIPGISDIVERLLAKRPEQRFQSAADFAFALELLRRHAGSTISATKAAAASARSGDPSHEVTFKQLTFRDGEIEGARFAPDGQTVAYRAAWGGGASDIYITRIESPEASPLGLPDAGLEAVSSSAELAITLRSKNLGGFIRVGTLARIPMVGGRPREVAESVYLADWSPDGKSLAAIRLVDGRLQLEAPLGRVVHVAAGWISYPRWSPDGSMIAFGEHPAMGNNAGFVAVVRPGEPARRITPRFEMVTQMAWRPDSREVWFGGQMEERGAGVYGATIDGAVRRVYSAPGWPFVTDIAKNGDALLVMVRPRMRLEVGTRGGGLETIQDLSWLDWSLLRDMSPDGSMVLFDETGIGTGGIHGVYLRTADGAPAIRLADGICSSLSPDGRWALVGDDREPNIIRMVPTGAGETRTLDLGDFSVDFADWIPGGDRLLLTGTEPGGPRRIWIYDAVTGERRAIGDESIAGFAVRMSPDGRYATFRTSEGLIQIIDVDSGAVRGFDLVDPNMRPAGWTADSKAFFAVNGGGLPARVLRLDVSSGASQPWMEIWPSQRSGVDHINSLRLSADGERYACSYPMIDASLYLARGLV